MSYFQFLIMSPLADSGIQINPELLSIFDYAATSSIEFPHYKIKPDFNKKNLMTRIQLIKFPNKA